MKKLSKTQVTDILLLGFISGVVAILTSFMGISGTIIGAVVTSIIAETLKTYFKEPIKDKKIRIFHEQTDILMSTERIHIQVCRDLRDMKIIHIKQMMILSLRQKYYSYSL